MAAAQARIAGASQMMPAQTRAANPAAAAVEGTADAAAVRRRSLAVGTIAARAASKHL